MLPPPQPPAPLPQFHFLPQAIATHPSYDTTRKGRGKQSLPFHTALSSSCLYSSLNPKDWPSSPSHVHLPCSSLTTAHYLSIPACIPQPAAFVTACPLLNVPMPVFQAFPFSATSMAPAQCKDSPASSAFLLSHSWNEGQNRLLVGLTLTSLLAPLWEDVFPSLVFQSFKGMFPSLGIWTSFLMTIMHPTPTNLEQLTRDLKICSHHTQGSGRRKHVFYNCF